MTDHINVFFELSKKCPLFSSKDFSHPFRSETPPRPLQMLKNGVNQDGYLCQVLAMGTLRQLDSKY